MDFKIKNMKRILLPTDFSGNAYNAARYAVNLFKGQPCTFYLVHTYTPAIYQAEYLLHSPGQLGLGDVYKEHSINQLEAMRAKIESEFGAGPHTFKTHSAFNLLADELRQLARDEQADLIIMGTQGATGAQEIMMGTHTVHVIKRAPCPVIIVPSHYAYQAPKEILFPTDFEVDFNGALLGQLIDVAKMHASRLSVVHVVSGFPFTEAQLVYKKNLGQLLSKIDHEFHELPDQTVIDGINNFQTARPMRLLAMVQNKHTFLEKLFIEPVIKKIAFHVKIPFMVIPLKN